TRQNIREIKDIPCTSGVWSAGLILSGCLLAEVVPNAEPNSSGGSYLPGKCGPSPLTERRPPAASHCSQRSVSDIFLLPSTSWPFIHSSTAAYPKVLTSSRSLSNL